MTGSTVVGGGGRSCGGSPEGLGGRSSSSPEGDSSDGFDARSYHR